MGCGDILIKSEEILCQDPVSLIENEQWVSISSCFQFVQNRYKLKLNKNLKNYKNRTISSESNVELALYVNLKNAILSAD